MIATTARSDLSDRTPAINGWRELALTSENAGYRHSGAWQGSPWFRFPAPSLDQGSKAPEVAPISEIRTGVDNPVAGI